MKTQSEVLMALISGKKMTNMNLPNNTYIYQSGIDVIQSEDGVETFVDMEMIAEGNWMDVEDILEHINDQDTIVNKTIAERKQMYINHVSNEMNKISGNGEWVREVLTKQANIEDITEIVASSIEAALFKKENQSNETLLRLRDNAVTDFKLVEETKYSKYNVEEMKNFYELLYFHGGGKPEHINMYGIEMLVKLDLPLSEKIQEGTTEYLMYRENIEDRDVFISYLNKELAAKGKRTGENQGHFQVYNYSEKVMDNKAFSIEFEKTFEEEQEVSSQSRGFKKP